MNVLQVVKVLWLHAPDLFNLGAFATWQGQNKKTNIICLSKLRVNGDELSEQFWQQSKTQQMAFMSEGLFSRAVVLDAE